MRILLDESIPSRLEHCFPVTGLSASNVAGGLVIKKGKLLALAAGEFDVLLTADKGMEYQQNLSALPVSILVVLARSNRMEHLSLAVPLILETLQQMLPRTLRKIAIQLPPDAGST